VEQYRIDGQAIDDNIIRRMRVACRITKGTKTNPEYVILIAFQRQQWLRERVTIFHYIYICLSCSTYNSPRLTARIE
jgi:hypothetical protein